MGSIANIVLNDAESTPVVHTFKPARQGLQPNGHSIAVWEDRSVNNGTPVGYYRLSSQFSPPVKQRASYKVAFRLDTPIMEVLSNSSLSGFEPRPTVASLPFFEGAFLLPDRSALQDRKNLRKMTYEFFNTAALIAMIEELDFPN
jgi:hypothetical protein